jgi:hypothetical protein
MPPAELCGPLLGGVDPPRTHLWITVQALRRWDTCPSSLRMRHVDQGVRLDGGPACDHSQK